jgi:hypothetical protein
MNIKVNLTRKLVETLTREIIAENRAKKVFMEEEKTLSPETEKMVQDAVNALLQSNKGKIDENLDNDTAEIVMKTIAGLYTTAIALGVGNLIKVALETPKNELKDAFEKIASQVKQKGRDRGL